MAKKNVNERAQEDKANSLQDEMRMSKQLRAILEKRINGNKELLGVQKVILESIEEQESAEERIAKVEELRTTIAKNYRGLNKDLGGMLIAQLDTAKERLKLEQQAEEIYGRISDRTNSIVDGFQRIVEAIPGIGPSLSRAMDFDGIKERFNKDITENMVNGFMNASAAGGGLMSQIKGQLGGLMTGVKSFGKGLLTALGPLGLIAGAIAAVVFLFKQAVDLAMEQDKQVASAAKNLQIGKDAAQELFEISSDIGVSFDRFAETVGVIKDELGIIPVNIDESGKAIDRLVFSLGMGNDEIANLFRTSLETGQSFDNFTTSVARGNIEMMQSTGFAISLQDTFEGISKTTADIRRLFGGSTKELQRQFAVAKQLGFTLEQLNSSSADLLNIESSLEKEMIARVMTQRALNLDKARQAAIDGDLATVGEEITRQAGSLSEFLEYDRFTQEALADAVGMQAGQLFEVLTTQRLNNAAIERGLSSSKMLTNEDKARLLIKEGLSDEEVRQFMLRQQNLSIEEKFNEAQTLFKETISKNMTGLASFIEGISDLGLAIAEHGFFDAVIRGKAASGPSPEQILADPNADPMMRDIAKIQVDRKAEVQAMRGMGPQIDNEAMIAKLEESGNLIPLNNGENMDKLVAAVNKNTEATLAVAKEVNKPSLAILENNTIRGLTEVQADTANKSRNHSITRRN